MSIVRKMTDLTVALSLVFVLSPGVYAQTPFTKNSLVMQKCSACHKPDKTGRLEVLEETRKTPEEWKNVVDRMIRLNDVPLEDAQFNPVIKELSRYLSLTPAEMAQIAYINSDENSQYREIPKTDLEKRMYTACVRCHTWGKIASHRNTPSQWAETRIMHLAYYPTAILQMREMNWPKEFQDLLEPLSRMFPFETTEWREWLKNRSDPALAGEWQVAGYQPGKGYYSGTFVITPDPQNGEGEFRIEKRIQYNNGQAVTFIGIGTLYSGYHLRTAMTSSNGGAQVEGVFDLDAAEMAFKGKWWEAVQDKNSFGNEIFYKFREGFRIIAAFPQSLRAGNGVTQDLKLIGMNISEGIQPADITFSDPHIFPEKVKKEGDTELVIGVTVTDKADNGPVTVSVKGVPYKHPLVVFNDIDGIKIFPEIGRARVSCGQAYPAQGVQFVARAVNYGKDGKADTEDDLLLEPVTAEWWLEEEDTSVSTLMKGLRLAGIYPKFGRETDDDLKYLKTDVKDGLYTPVTTYGPIKERVQHTQGTGLIAIGASYAEGGTVHKDRSLLAVTVPDFIPQMK